MGMLFARTVRLTKLDVDGSPLVGPGNTYTTQAIVQLNLGLNFTENEPVEQKNGRGQTCVYYKAPDTVTSGSISDFTFCSPDPHVLTFLIGGTVFTTGGTNEVQTVTITGTPTGGTFTLSLEGNTTDPIAYNAATTAVQAALVALPNLSTGDVTVTGSAGGPFTVTFGGSRSGQDVAQITGSGTGLTGGTTPAVTTATTTQGSGGTEVGYAAPRVNTNPIPNGVGIELWANNIVNNAPDPVTPFFHIVTGRSFLRLPEGFTISGENAATPTFEGSIDENPNFGDGPAGDIAFPTESVWQYMGVATEPTSVGLGAVA